MIPCCMLLLSITLPTVCADFTHFKPHEMVAWQAAHIARIKPQKCVILQTGNQYGLLPQQVADTATFIRDNFIKPNIISLDELPYKDAFDISILIPLIMQAKKILIKEPESARRSYIHLAQEEPLTSVHDCETLLKLFIACDFLQLDVHPVPVDPMRDMLAFMAANSSKNVTACCCQILNNKQHDYDQPVLKAIAFRFAQLGLKDPFIILDKIALNMNYNFKDRAWPYIQAQCFLLKQPLVYDAIFDICLRDLLIYCLEPRYYNDCAGLTLDLTNLRLTSLDGINKLWHQEIRILLLQHNKLKTIPSLDLTSLHSIFAQNNALTEIPPLKLRHLKHLDLRQNNITSLPNDLSDLPQLESLDLRGNPITKIPHNIKKSPYLVIHLDDRRIPSDNDIRSADMWLRQPKFLFL